jgi:L-ascorbate metabolism protein UlaG (beta-lactamase superfamily)
METVRIFRERPGISSPLPAPVSAQLIGGPTAVIEIGGVRLLTDPTFDPPRTFEESGVPVVTKLRGPALFPEQLGAVDAVLLSHDLHPDNLDDAGRACLSRAAAVLTTRDGPAVYVSGDNAALAVVAQIVERAGSPETGCEAPRHRRSSSAARPR